MLHALLRKKLRVVETAIEYRDVEDHLTAAVLTRLSYLTPGLATRLIESSIAGQSLGQPSAPRAVSDDDEIWVDFWPRFSDPTSSRSTVEPDAVLVIGGHTYVVEVKRTDEGGQSAGQAVRDWLSYYFDDDEDEEPDEDEFAGTLLMLGGIPDVGKFRALASDIERNLRDPKGNEADSHNAGDPPGVLSRIAWIPWSKFANNVRELIQAATPPEARVLEDLDLALSYHGFGAWLTFEQLLHVVNARFIGLGDGSLPMKWPTAPRLTATSAPAAPVPALNPIARWWSQFASTRIEVPPDGFRVFTTAG